MTHLRPLLLAFLAAEALDLGGIDAPKWRHLRAAVPAEPPSVLVALRKCAAARYAATPSAPAALAPDEPRGEAPS